MIFNQPSLARILRTAFPARPIFHYAQNEPFGRSTLRSARAVLDDVDGVICCSEFIAKRAAIQTGTNDPKIVPLLNGVDSVAFSPGAGDRNGPPVVLFVGRVSPHKGVHHLVDAALELRRRGVDFRLRIVGSSDLLTVAELSAYERDLRAAAVPLGDRCEFLPFVDRSGIADVYRSADVMTVPSAFDEPFGLVALEAQACGLPLVASTRGGLPEAGGTVGRYVDVGDPVAFADALQPLLVDAELRRRVSTESRRWAESMDWHHRFDQLLEITGVECP